MNSFQEGEDVNNVEYVGRVVVVGYIDYCIGEWIGDKDTCADSSCVE